MSLSARFPRGPRGLPSTWALSLPSCAPRPTPPQGSQHPATLPVHRCIKPHQQRCAASAPRSIALPSLLQPTETSRASAHYDPSSLPSPEGPLWSLPLPTPQGAGRGTCRAERSAAPWARARKTDTEQKRETDLVLTWHRKARVLWNCWGGGRFPLQSGSLQRWR